MKKTVLFLVLLLIVSTPVLADIVEITIEYNQTGCTENWSCTGWSACSNGIQTRTCTDLNNCGTTVNKPVESQSCTTGGEVPSGGGAPTGGTPPSYTPTSQPQAQPSGASIESSIDESIAIHLNESYNLNIKVKNNGNVELKNVIIDVIGLPAGSFSVFPLYVASLSPSDSTTFLISIMSHELSSGAYPLIINVTSLEAYKTMNTRLVVKPVTYEEAKKREALLFSEMVLVGSVALIIILVIILVRIVRTGKGKEKVQYVFTGEGIEKIFE